ncbi:MAG: flagellar biosynthesis protein FliQ [Gemmatimonadetes bacterium]|nr:flagellar biosynthesis protein FliQ [Gemmatimonadota bacterium]
MTDLVVVDLARRAMLMALALGGPLLLVALVVGLLISILQAVTQVQEQTLAFVPKLVAVGLVFLIGLPWMLQLAVNFTSELFRSLPALAS